MKKRLCVWLSLLLALCLTACGGASGVSGGGAPTESPDLLDVARTARALFDDAQDGGETAGGASEVADDYGDSDAPDGGASEAPDAYGGYGGETADNYGDYGGASDDYAFPDGGTPDASEPVADGGALDESGAYTSAEDVALYLHTYGRLPGNFITKKQAQALGWEGGFLEPYAPGKCIGGDRFGNYEGLLPSGRNYRECDIDTLGAKSRGAKRLVFSDDGLIYYTDDHYNTFTLLYGEA
jgi:hypothetical protein